ncbi:MAG TPA: serine hydrolase domain-containing protein [Actinomycetota bacterium]|nr:serine hydrolase domain-containing protein [Actinomycetota bacterium]
MSSVASLSDRYQQTVTAFVREHRLPGAVAGVVHGDGLVWSGGAGLADVEAGRAPDATTLYRIASITKTFTATAIMQLRDEGKLHLDDPAVAYLPELRRAASPFGLIETVTIRRLLSHESGLMGDPPDADWTRDVYESSPAVNLARADEIATRLPPNAQQKYSNLGYQLLGEIVARVAGVPYVDHVRTQILEPLGMTSTAFPPLSDALAARAAVGYRGRWMSDVPVPARRLRTFPSAEGGLWSCVDDVGRWIVAQFLEDGGDRSGAQVLAGASLREMHQPRYLGDDAWTEAYGIGWYGRRRGETVWLMHSGGLPGFSTNACYRVPEKVGAIALLNGVAPPADLSMALAELALEAARAAASMSPPTPLPEAFADLLGLYGDAEDGILVRIEWRDNRLTMVDPDDPDWKAVFTPTGEPDRFTVDPGMRQSGDPVIFHRGADGRVHAVTMGPFSLSRFEPVAG